MKTLSLRRAPAALLALLLSAAWTPGAIAQDGSGDAGSTAEPAAPQQRARGGADPSDDAFEMGSPPALPDGVTEEEVWPSATAEGWRQPCLVPWQRSFEDATRVARATNRPLLVAVNMDGEIASEHFAGVRYRQPETAAMMSRYACVIASVYRHTPRDHDELGRRVECPRFGTVTCGEHIQAERDLYDTYFDGRRISPRHIVLDLEGKEVFDVYFSWDTASVFKTFVRGVEGWPEPNEPVEQTLENLAVSADAADRVVLERRYRAGTREERVAILSALDRPHEVDQVEVLRAAVFGFDTDLARLARRALAQCDGDDALDLIAEALKAPLEAEERDMLLAAVERMAPGSKRARTLAALHSGIALTSRHIDSELEASAREYEAAARGAVDVLERGERDIEHPRTLLARAEALLERALQTADPEYRPLWLEDARRVLDRAIELGAHGPYPDALRAVVRALDRAYPEATELAVRAVEAGVLLRDDNGIVLADAVRARVLRLFASARRRAIREAYREGREWPAEWLSDVNGAYAALAELPDIDAGTLIEQQDFLRWIGASERADAVLEEALALFPDSAELHERLRGRLLWQGGPKGLEQDYARRLAARPADEERADQLTWFAGYAYVVAAEQHRRVNDLEAALASYTNADAAFARNAELFPDGTDNCDHYRALAAAGRARVELERGGLVAGADAIVAALGRRPASATSLDGLGITPLATARMLHARLSESGDEANATRVQAAIDALDPLLLEPPPSERFGSGGRRRNGR